MRTDLKEVEQRIKAHWYRDGIGDFVGGLVFMLLGAYFALVEFLGENSTWGGLLEAGFILVFLGLFYFGRTVIKELKARYVFPRAGFVEYRGEKEHQSSRRFVALLLAAVIAAVIVLVNSTPGRVNWVVVITGILAGVILVFIQVKSVGIRRFFGYGIASALLGIAFGLSGLADGYALGSYYGAMGLVLAAIGFYVWQRFLRDNPLPEESLDEN